MPISTGFDLTTATDCSRTYRTSGAPVRPLWIALLSTLSLAALLHAREAAAIAAPAANNTTALGSSILGHVTRPNGNPAGSASLMIRENGHRTVTSADGSYVFRSLASGTYTVVLMSASGTTVERQLTVADGAALTADLTAADPGSAAAGSAMDEIVVQAQRSTVALARQAQREAPNLVNIQTFEEIRKLPDISTAEAVRRVPGISLESDEGEGRYVNIRGLDADLNSTTFGGLRLPPTNNASPFGGYRAVTLDSIPIGLVGALTVTKSNLPSQDAEALGGTIEITPKTAPRGGQPFLQGNIGTGYEPLRKTFIGDVSVTAGGHFGGSDGFFSSGPFSIVLTGTYYEDRRGFDDVEPAYFNDAAGTDGARPRSALSNIDQRDYELNRKRHGYGIDLGYEPDADNRWYIRAFEAGYSERYLRPHLSITPDGGVTLLPSGQLQDTLAAPGAIVKQLRDEFEKSRDRVFVAGGKNVFGDNTLDYRVGYTEGIYQKFYDYNSTFTLDPAQTANSVIAYNSSGPGHVPIYTITGAPYTDPKNFALTGFGNSTAYNYDREFSAAVNYERQAPLFGADSGSFKFGGSARIRHKRTTAQPRSYATLPNLGLADAASSANENYYNGLYQNGVDIRPGLLQGQLGVGTVGAPEQISADQQFLNAHEDVYAGYGEYFATWNRFSFIAGVRVEHTRDRLNAFSITTSTPDPITGVTTVTPSLVSARASYTNAFPSVQLKYEIQPDLVARATYSSTIARPGFNQSSAALGIDLGSGTVTQGNPNLRPATANSFDVTIEKYLGSAGIISAGFFYKDISNYILPSVLLDQPVVGIPGLLRARQVITFTNAGSSYARGVELNFDHRFKELPGLFGGFGLSANFTYVDSRVLIRPNEHSTLPSTSKYSYNAALFYEQGPVNLRLAAYSTSADLFGIGGDKTSDVYNATRTSLDFGGSYAFTSHLTAYFNAKNLLNTPHAFYQGTPDRPIQREFYRETYQIGVRFDY